jgi:hypothetical protein
VKPRLFSVSADLSAAIPDREASRLDRIAAAMASLSAEARRLERLGLSEPLAECRRQLRYWNFLYAIFSIAPDHRDEERERESA